MKHPAPAWRGRQPAWPREGLVAHASARVMADEAGAESGEGGIRYAIRTVRHNRVPWPQVPLHRLLIRTRLDSLAGTFNIAVRFPLIGVVLAHCVKLWSDDAFFSGGPMLAWAWCPSRPPGLCASLCVAVRVDLSRALVAQSPTTVGLC